MKKSLTKHSSGTHISHPREIREKGQAILLVLVSLGLFVIGGIGFGIDGANLYAHRQMAQTAADAAAQAGMLSLFNSTQGSEPTTFSTSPSTGFTCATPADNRTPCAYAQRNGFNTSADTVVIDFSPTVPAPTGVLLDGTSPTNLVRASVTRTVKTTLLRFLGPSSTTVTAKAIAAIVSVASPVPILVTHPSLSGALELNGTGSGDKLRITGGPSRSIQINSSNGTATTVSGSPVVNLSSAGPTGTGADFGSWGGPPIPPPFVFTSGTGSYVQPASPIRDPLANVAAPSSAGFPAGAVTGLPVATTAQGCPLAPLKPCELYSPGLYTSSIDVKNHVGVFKPGIYYMNGASFGSSAGGHIVMAIGFTDTGAGTTSTGWTGNVLIYLTGAGSPANTGKFDVGSNGDLNLTGSPSGSSYKGILVFVDRNSAAHIGNANAHQMGGGGSVTIIGTIYATNTLAIMTSTPGQYQEFKLQGTPGSATNITGEIIASKLTLGGTSTINMNLSSVAAYTIRQVALVQ